MPALSGYSNVYNTALGVLKEKGFQIWYSKEADTYCAEKNGWDFYADDPCALLGLVGIYEHQRPATYSEYWWKKDMPQLYGNLPEGPMPYHATIEKSGKK